MTGCASISAFVSLVGIPLVITSCTIGLKSYVKRYKSINKKKNKHDKIISLGKSKSNTIEVLISKALIYSNISHDEFALVIIN